MILGKLDDHQGISSIFVRSSVVAKTVVKKSEFHPSSRLEPVPPRPPARPSTCVSVYARALLFSRCLNRPSDDCVLQK